MLSKKIRSYLPLLIVLIAIATNVLILYLLVFLTEIFNLPRLIMFLSAMSFFILFNTILWLVGIFGNTENEVNKRIFREFTQNINEVFWRMTPDLSQTIYVSAAYNEIWGRSRENLFTNPQEWFEAIIPQDQERVKTKLQSLMDENVPHVRLEFTIQRPNGDLRQIDMRGFKFRDNHGVVTNILGISTDITAYKQEEKAKAILNDVKSLLERKSDLASIASKLLKIICTAFQWDFGEMWLIDKEANVLRNVTIYDNTGQDFATEFDIKSQQMTFEPGMAVPGEIWKLGNLLWLETFADIKLERIEEATAAGFQSVVGMPIIMNNNIIGVLDFFSHKIRKPDDAIINVLEKIGEQLSLYIEKKHTEDQIIYASQHDSQTFLLNQSALRDNLKKALGGSSVTMALFLFEVNKLNLINSIIGPEASDILLERIVERFRKIIAHPDLQLGRYESNVFAFYLPFHSVEELSEFASVVLRQFNDPFYINHEDIFLSLNIGITTTMMSGNDIDVLFRHANLALSRATEIGKNTFNFFSAEMSYVVHEQIILEASLRHALTNNEFCLYYQPKVNLKTGQITGAEALIRWLHPTKGLLEPAAFIPLAEETGLIIQLDEWVLREVFTLLKADWPMNPNGKATIAINISSQHFLAKNDIFVYINSLVQEFNVNPKPIEIEISESVVLTESQYTLNALNKLIKMGFNLSLDDFGTGFNSLRYLLRVPAQTVKIDKSFIDGLPKNQNNIAIVRAMITLCHSLNKKVIAEGVETLEQIEFLKHEACDEIQGFYFSRPVPLQEFKHLITSQKKLIFEDFNMD